MGRSKIYTPELLSRRIDAYFRAIRITTPRLTKEMIYAELEDGKIIPEIDENGHEKKEWRRVRAENGKNAVTVEYTEPPSITGLCLFLCISPQTWAHYCKDDAFLEPTTRARERVQEYLISQLADPRAVRGAMFALEYNFGWKSRREIGFDEQTQKAIAASGMTMDEKLALLAQMGLHLPEDTEENDAQR